MSRSSAEMMQRVDLKEVFLNVLVTIQLLDKRFLVV